MQMLAFNLAALLALAAAAALPFSGAAAKDPRNVSFWLTVVCALAGTGAWTWTFYATHWRTGFAPTLWVTITATLVLFVLGAVASRTMARLSGLLVPYLLALGIIGTVWAHAPARPISADAPGAWLDLHIVVAVTTYALFTLAAVAGLAVFLQERALKARRLGRMTALLPPVAEGEALQRRLMIGSAAVLGLGLASGMVTEFLETGLPLMPTHKVVFTVAAFVVIVVLVAVDRASGIAGRRAARMLLLAYLLLTLGYPGVKFVTDVVLRSPAGIAATAGPE